MEKLKKDVIYVLKDKKAEAMLALKRAGINSWGEYQAFKFDFTTAAITFGVTLILAFILLG